MTRLEEIKKQVDSLRLEHGVLELLPSILKDDEVIKQTTMGYYEGGLGSLMGSLIATDRRFIHCAVRSPGTSYTDSFWFDDLKSITIGKTKGMSGGHRDVVLVDVANQKFDINRILMLGSWHGFIEHIKPMLDDPEQANL